MFPSLPSCLLFKQYDTGGIDEGWSHVRIQGFTHHDWPTLMAQCRDLRAPEVCEVYTSALWVSSNCFLSDLNPLFIILKLRHPSPRSVPFHLLVEAGTAWAMITIQLGGGWQLVVRQEMINPTNQLYVWTHICCSIKYSVHEVTHLTNLILQSEVSACTLMQIECYP